MLNGNVQPPEGLSALASKSTYSTYSPKDLFFFQPYAHARYVVPVAVGHCSTGPVNRAPEPPPTVSLLCVVRVQATTSTPPCWPDRWRLAKQKFSPIFTEKVLVYQPLIFPEGEIKTCTRIHIIPPAGTLKVDTNCYPSYSQDPSSARKEAATCRT